MPETKLIPCGYHVIRYTPNLVRDEWVNIGVILFEVESGRVLFRLPDQDGDWLRVRRLHPQADETLLRRLPEEFEARLAGPKGSAESPLGNFRRWSETLGDTVQLSPQKGLLAEDLDAELDRLYRDQVEPVRATRRLEDLSTAMPSARAPIRCFAAAGIWPRLERRVRVDEFTYHGRSLAPRLCLSPQRHARIRAGFAAGARPGPGQGAGLHRRCDSRQVGQDGISGGLRNRAAPAGKRAPPIRHRLARGARNSRLSR